MQTIVALLVLLAVAHVAVDASQVLPYIPLFGANKCTGNPLGGLWSQVQIPPECKTELSNDNVQCATKMVLWKTNFLYCCPYAGGWVPTPGHIQPTRTQGLGPAPAWLLQLMFGKLVAWRGSACPRSTKPLGCAIFYDCESSTCEAACTGMGRGLCSWTGRRGAACIEKPAVIDNYFCAPTATPSDPQPRLTSCAQTNSPTNGD